jgi:hypothetical protein
MAAIPGALAAAVLERRPSEFRPIADRLATWLAGWSHATAAVSSAGILTRELAGAASVLEPRIPSSAGYFAHLSQLIASQGDSIPCVASHNDLTMWNVLVQESRLGILDWEGARSRGIPLVDLFYAVVDAAAACESYRDRRAAFESCLTGVRRESMEPLVQRVGQPLGLSREAVEVCFHLCWLGHAANEVRRRPKDPAGPFLQIVRNLAGTGRSW